MEAASSAGVRPPQSDSVSLSFLDLLYAVPIADLATRVSGTELRGIPWQGWGDIALVLAVVVLAWIGHHRNRDLAGQQVKLARARPGQFDFRELRFVQFLVEVLVIVNYFVLGVRVELSRGAVPSATWQTSWLVVLFGLYVIWDLLDIKIAKTDQPWKKRAKTGGTVSGVFLAIFGLLRLLVWLNHDHSRAWVVAVDIGAIALLYVYRATQEAWQNAAYTKAAAS